MCPRTLVVGKITLQNPAQRPFIPHDDPEGAEEPSARNQHPYGSVDQRSLLNLSQHDTSESEPDCEAK